LTFVHHRFSRFINHLFEIILKALFRSDDFYQLVASAWTLASTFLVTVVSPVEDFFAGVCALVERVRTTSKTTNFMPELYTNFVLTTEASE
jgi:hypothetical protein